MAEMVLFLVNILNIGTRSYDASLVVAVNESEGMPQLVNDLFSESVYQQFIVPFHAITFISKPKDGGNSGSASGMPDRKYRSIWE